MHHPLSYLGLTVMPVRMPALRSTSIDDEYCNEHQYRVAATA
jgi:hypothetical protein